MRKLSLLLGTLGGAMAGYILSNDKLRQELMKAKDGEEAAKTLGQHLAKDGKKIAKEAKSFVESEDVQKNLKKAKAYATSKLADAKDGMSSMMKKGKSEAKKMVKKGMKKIGEVA